MRQPAPPPLLDPLPLPEEMRLWAGEMLVLWVEHLADNIPTVRENSAVALGKAGQQDLGDTQQGHATCRCRPFGCWAAAATSAIKCRSAGAHVRICSMLCCMRTANAWRCMGLYVE